MKVVNSSVFLFRKQSQESPDAPSTSASAPAAPQWSADLETAIRFRLQKKKILRATVETIAARIPKLKERRELQLQGDALKAIRTNSVPGEEGGPSTSKGVKTKKAKGAPKKSSSAKGFKSGGAS